MKKPINMYENIVESLNEGVIGIDERMVITIYNHAAERISGLSRTLTINKALSEVFPRDVWLSDMMEQTLRHGTLFIEHEDVISQRMGGTVPVSVTTSTMLDGEGNVIGAVALLSDLSSIQSIREDSMRKERLAFLGTVAAGIAHEVKNPLGGIRGAAQLLSRKVKEESLVEYTDIIVREVDRLNRILEDVLDFANPRKINPLPININEVLDRVVFLGQGMTQEKEVQIIKNYDPSLPLVIGDKELLIQVFLNMVKNSVEAVSAKGMISVTTKMLTDFRLIEEGYKANMMAAIEIADNGCGIPKDVMDKIFTPFFTTKAKGSGLGLALSFRVIKEHGGFFKIDSEEKKGTIVTVFLPLA